MFECDIFDYATANHHNVECLPCRCHFGVLEKHEFLYLYSLLEPSISLRSFIKGSGHITVSVSYTLDPVASDIACHPKI